VILRKLSSKSTKNAIYLTSKITSTNFDDESFFIFFYSQPSQLPLEIDQEQSAQLHLP
jgi:hypothetical protein